MNSQIREVGVTDFERLCALFVEENRFHAHLVPAYIQVTPQVLTSEEVQGFLNSQTHRLPICEDGDTLLGAIIVSAKDKSEERWNKRRRFGYVEDLIVTATAQGCGIETQLMQAARCWVMSQGIQTIEPLMDKHFRVGSVYQARRPFDSGPQKAPASAQGDVVGSKDCARLK